MVRFGWANIALACILFSGCLASVGSFESVPSAGWKAGYRFETSLEIEVANHVVVKVDGEVKDTASSSETNPPVMWDVIEVLTTELEDGGVPLYLVSLDAELETKGVNLQSGPFSIGSGLSHGDGPVPGLLAVRQQDLDALLTTLSVEVDCSSRCQVDAHDLGVSSDGSVAPYVQFPLAAGDSWSWRKEAGDPTFGDTIMKATVAGSEQVDGPAGPVDAIRIDHVGRPEGMQKVEQEVKEDIASEGGTDITVDLDFVDRHAVYFAPSLHAVVLHEFRLELDVDIRYTMEGDRVEVDGDSHVGWTLRLTDADLDEREDPGVEGAIAAFEELIEAELNGEAPIDVDVPQNAVLAATASPSRVNTAEEGAFTLTLTGPAASVSWLVLDAEGTEVATAEGATASFQPTTPGLFVAIAEGFDAQGNSIGQTGVLLPADHIRTETITCYPVALGFAGECDPVTAPVGPGVGTVRITATEDAIVSLGGTLELKLADGQSTQTHSTTGTATVAMAGSPGEATSTFTPDAAAMDYITFAIEVIAGDAKGASGGTEDSLSALRAGNLHAHLDGIVRNALELPTAGTP